MLQNRKRKMQVMDVGGGDDARYGNGDSRYGSGGSGGSRHDGQDMRGNDEDVGDEGDIVSGVNMNLQLHIPLKGVTL